MVINFWFSCSMVLQTFLLRKIAHLTIRNKHYIESTRVVMMPSGTVSSVADGAALSETKVCSVSSPSSHRRFCSETMTLLINNEYLLGTFVNNFPSAVI
jgi:hypothetical protein